MYFTVARDVAETKILLNKLGYLLPKNQFI